MMSRLIHPIVTTQKPSRDNVLTIAAIGLLAYLSADVAHHALGHGTVCVALGGQIVSLSSIYLDCTIRGTGLDLAGPFANLAVGLLALVAERFAANASSPARLFCVLVAAFNLFWFEMQLAFSAATRTDDWAWSLQYYGMGEPVRYALIAGGALAYLATIRIIAVHLSPFAQSRARVSQIAVVAWLMAGVLACATGLFDPHPISAILRHAAPQSLGNSVGLLFIPVRASRFASSAKAASVLPLLLSWIIAATLAAAASIVLLGPGISV